MLFINTVIIATYIWALAINGAPRIRAHNYDQVSTASNNGKPTTMTKASQESITSSRTKTDPDKGTLSDSLTQDEPGEVLGRGYPLVGHNGATDNLMINRNHHTMNDPFFELDPTPSPYPNKIAPGAFAKTDQATHVSGKLEPLKEHDEYADLEKGNLDIFPPHTIEGVLEYMDQLQEGIEGIFNPHRGNGH